MNQELHQRVKQFETDFLDKYPHVDQPLPLLADFAAYLNEVKTASSERGETTRYGETIHSILVLLSNSDLERFADADFRKSTLIESPQAGQPGDHANSKDADAIERGANEAVYGHAEAGLAGLKGMIARLNSEL